MLTETDRRQPDAGARSLEKNPRPGQLRKQINAEFTRLAGPKIAPPQTWYLTAKAVADRVVALVLLVLTAPLVLLAALLVKLTSAGPAFYTQTRVGRHGRLFTIYKLRTMVDNCESLTGPRWSMPGDPRVTWLGRILRLSHLDELPQLVNVLRGDMSLIGPRPERPEFVPELDQAFPGYRCRLAVRPGVTGLAQVSQGADTDLDSVRRKLAYDLYYIKNLGFGLELRILVCTALYTVGVPFRVSRRLLRLPPGPAAEKAVQPLLAEASPARPRKLVA